MKAVLCPVCNGKGLIYGGAETGTAPTQTCHGCGGKGWVEVGDDDDDDPINLELNWRQTQSDLAKCPACGGDRNDPPLTGCPKGAHYGTWCYDS